MKKIILTLALLSVVACTPMTRGGSSQETSILPNSAQDNHNSAGSKGVVNYVWEEPMVDTVDVPPGLDPDGVYYRPGHKEVVEVRQGHWQNYQ